MLSARLIKEEDWEHIAKWSDSRADWSRTFPSREYLPENGLGGVIVSNGNTPFVVGFLYFNPVLSFIEWVISDPDYKEDNRSEGVKLCLQELCNVAGNLGAKGVFSVTKNKGLINKLKEVGFNVDPNLSHECIKIIN